MNQSTPIRNHAVRIQAVRHREAVAPPEAVILLKAGRRTDQTIRRDIEISALRPHP